MDLATYEHCQSCFPWDSKHVLRSPYSCRKQAWPRSREMCSVALWMAVSLLCVVSVTLNVKSKFALGLVMTFGTWVSVDIQFKQVQLKAT